MALIRIFIGALIVIPLVLAGCDPNNMGAKELGIRLKLDKYTLSNGLTVIIAEDHTMPIVSYQTWVKVGSVDEHPGISGISHLFEHLMFKGTQKFGPSQIFKELESKGAEINAYTSRDYTTYYENFAPPLLAKVIEIESDRMAHLLLTEETLNNERMIVLEERRLRRESTPNAKMEDALWELAYKHHPYHWPVIGYEQDIQEYTLDLLKEHFHRYYQPANAAIVVAGDIEPASTLQLIRKYYGDIPSSPRPKRSVAPEPEQQEERQKVITDNVASERFSQAYHITAAANNESYAIDVLTNILFEGRNSRAYRRLVEDRQLALSVSGSSYTPTYPGLLMIAATMKRGIPATQGEAELQKLIDDIQEGGTRGATEEEVQTAIRQLTVQIVDSVRTIHGLAQLIGTVETVFGDPYRFATDIAKYTRVTRSDVRKVAQKYLVPNNRSVVILQPVAASFPTKEVK